MQVLNYNQQVPAYNLEVDLGYTATDFNQHSSPGTVADAAARVVKAATLDAGGPTGQVLQRR